MGQAEPAPTPGAAAPSASPFVTAAMWKLLTDGPDIGARCQSWAELMRELVGEIPGTHAQAVAAFRFDAAAMRLTPLGAAPHNRAVTGLMAETALAAAKAGRPVARGALPGKRAPSDGPMSAAVPVMIDGIALGTVCIEFAPTSDAIMRRTMRLLQWGAAWPRDELRAECADQLVRRSKAAHDALHSAITVAERVDFATAASAAVTDLATRFDCNRVALGMRRLGRSRVRAISHSAQFSRRMKLVQSLAATMDEAIDQRAAVLWPEPPETAQIYATAMARNLAREDAAGQIYTVPLYAMDRFVGALTFERAPDHPFSADELEILEATATVLAPIIEEKRQNDRWLITRAARSARELARQLLGPTHLLRKLMVMLLISVAALLWFVKAPLDVSATAQIMGTEERSIVPGFDGYIADAPVRAGDMVARGDLLVQLDDRDLMLERQRLITERQRQSIEYDRAVATRNRSETNVRKTLIEQANAEIALIDERIARTRLTAPFDGRVLSGDLSQSIGSAVSRGEPLMVIAPSGDYRIKLQVDERRIAQLAPGQTGLLRVTALPSESFAIRVEKITPVAHYSEGTTRFEVEARFEQDASALMPGMEGAARIEIGPRRLAEIWGGPLLDWARLTLWRWTPI